MSNCVGPGFLHEQRGSDVVVAIGMRIDREALDEQSVYFAG